MSFKYFLLSHQVSAKRAAKTYMENESPPDSHSYTLYRALALRAKTYMEALLKDESPPNGHPYSLGIRPYG